MRLRRRRRLVAAARGELVIASRIEVYLPLLLCASLLQHFFRHLLINEHASMLRLASTSVSGKAIPKGSTSRGDANFAALEPLLHRSRRIAEPFQDFTQFGESRCRRFCRTNIGVFNVGGSTTTGTVGSPGGVISFRVFCS